MSLITAEKQGEFGYGDVWTWTAIDADTKLIPSWFVGRRDAACAATFVRDLASRLKNRVQITTDGLKAYLGTVEHAFGADVDYAQLVKLYGEPKTDSPERKYSPSVCTGIRMFITSGDPDRFDNVKRTHPDRVKGTHPRVNGL